MLSKAALAFLVNVRDECGDYAFSYPPSTLDVVHHSIVVEMRSIKDTFTIVVAYPGRIIGIVMG